ncbi:hypothetical protein DX883_10600 [Vibrio fluvialis]|nr:hypothetical protein [Vibrio fluvialis]EKO3999883.1 hypothetical protein [Vibrio fluvialis]
MSTTPSLAAGVIWSKPYHLWNFYLRDNSLSTRVTITTWTFFTYKINASVTGENRQFLFYI